MVVSVTQLDYREPLIRVQPLKRKGFRKYRRELLKLQQLAGEELSDLFQTRRQVRVLKTLIEAGERGVKTTVLAEKTGLDCTLVRETVYPLFEKGLARMKSRYTGENRGKWFIINTGDDRVETLRYVLSQVDPKLLKIRKLERNSIRSEWNSRRLEEPLLERVFIANRIKVLRLLCTPKTIYAIRKDYRTNYDVVKEVLKFLQEAGLVQVQVFNTVWKKKRTVRVRSVYSLKDNEKTRALREFFKAWRNKKPPEKVFNSNRAIRVVIALVNGNQETLNTRYSKTVKKLIEAGVLEETGEGIKLAQNSKTQALIKVVRAFWR